MARRKRDGSWKPFYVELPVELIERLEAQARVNDRTRTQELIAHLKKTLKKIPENSVEKS